MAFKPPPGKRRAPVPPPRSGRSLLYVYGVVVEDDCPEPDPKRMHFYCMANASCREGSLTGSSGPIPIQRKATGNGTRHLKKMHSECCTMLAWGKEGFGERYPHVCRGFEREGGTLMIIAPLRVVALELKKRSGFGIGGR